MFPDKQTARDRFILDRRPARPVHDPWRAPTTAVELERTETGVPAHVATLFLTGRECPWRCTMCDLWQHTIATDTPTGAIAAQVRAAVEGLDLADAITRIKLYNAGSFFDSRAVPNADYEDIARAVARFERVVVESHPSLVGSRTTAWLDALARAAAEQRHQPPRLEVAMGLETVHPAALDRLNKRMTVDDFRRAADRLRAMNVDLRVFLLVGPPFVAPDAQDLWLGRSVETALDCGAVVVSLIPTRDGNGAIDALAEAGCFDLPRLPDLERALDLALAVPRPATARVFADLWDLERFSACPDCLGARRTRLEAINLSQITQPAIACPACSLPDPTGRT